MERLEGPHSVALNGSRLECVVCGHGEFFTGIEIVVMTGHTAGGLEIHNPKAEIAVCAECGFKHSFMRMELSE